MSWTYRCPHCKAMLNPHDTIILTAARGDTRILAGFHPEPGNYAIYFPPDVELQDGETWDFFCPVCQADLKMEDNENLCLLELQEGERESQILFSRVAGEQATYLVAGGAVTAKLGADAQNYFEYLMSVRFL